MEHHNNTTHSVRLKDGQCDTGNVVLLCANLDLRLGHVLQHHLIEVARGELGLGQRKGGLLHHLAHQRLGLNNSTQKLIIIQYYCII